MAISNPALRFYGSKWRIANWIVSQLPRHTLYCEPFGGSAAILLHKPRSPLEVLNDLDGHLVTFFQMLRDRTADLVRAIQLTPYSRREYELSLCLNDVSDPLEIARRFHVRSWMGYSATTTEANTGWRYQKSLDSRPLSITDEWNRTEHLETVAERLKAVQIECADWSDCIQRFDSPNTLFVCDPPYLVSTRNHHDEDSRAYRYEMSDDDHIHLAERLKHIQGKFVVCGYPSPLYNDLYRDCIQLHRTAATNAKSTRIECLWISSTAKRKAIAT
jgi:DNA adenine methylase